jgi:hypothetical protein
MRASRNRPGKAEGRNWSGLGRSFRIALGISQPANAMNFHATGQESKQILTICVKNFQDFSAHLRAGLSRNLIIVRP